jgi:drug/metabolite transporter (DMT)-like permease
VLLGITVLIWGLTWWPIDVASEHSTPIMLAMLRVAPTLVLLVAVFALLGRRLPRGRLLAASIGSGLLMFGTFQWVIMETVVTIGPGNSAVILNTPPLFVALLGFLIMRERLNALAVFGLAIGFAGVVLMVSSQVGDFPSAGTLLGGVATALAGAASWAVAALFLRGATRDRADVDMFAVTVVQYAAGSLLLVPLALSGSGISNTDWTTVELWVPLLWFGPITAVAMLIFFVVLQRMQAARATSVMFLIPGVAILVEILRGNVPSALALAGMFIAILGVGLVTAPPGAVGRLVPRVAALCARV